MKNLYQLLSYNQKFVEEKSYKKFRTSKFPDKKLVILSCMDTRLVELLPKSMNLKNGDIKIIKNAGAIVSHPFGSVMKSILIAIYELNAEEVLVIGHHDCGMNHIRSARMIERMRDRGISEAVFNTLENSGISLNSWLQGFSCIEDSVRNSVKIISSHPLLPKNLPVHGLVIDPSSGKLDLIIDGYTEE